jgi:hypothetical protein
MAVSGGNQLFAAEEGKNNDRHWLRDSAIANAIP